MVPVTVNGKVPAGVPVFEVVPPPAPPPHPATASTSNNPAASATTVDCHRLAPRCFQCLPEDAAVTNNKASANKPPISGDNGGSGGNGRDRGTLTEGAVVVTVTVTLVTEFPNVAGFGETVHVAREGTPLQPKVIIPVIPASLPMLNM